MKDSDAIEQAFISSMNIIFKNLEILSFIFVMCFLDNKYNESIIQTDGSRFDVYLNQRIRKPVYWSDKPTSVRRCSWFIRNRSGSNFIPYEETIATLLEVIMHFY